MDKSAPNKGFSSKAQLEPLAPRMKVGLFGGSFNPAHSGHVHVAQTASKRLGLHRVLWLVSPGNPLKSQASWGSYDRRVASAKSITSRLPGQFVCESEAAFGTRYSLDTIKGFQQRWPDVSFVWIIGADNLRQFHLWRNWRQIAKTIPIAIIARPSDPIRARLSPFARTFAASRLPQHLAKSLVNNKAPAWTYLNAPYSRLSSTAIRSDTDLASVISM